MHWPEPIKAPLSGPGRILGVGVDVSDSSKSLGRRVTADQTQHPGGPEDHD